MATDETTGEDEGAPQTAAMEPKPNRCPNPDSAYTLWDLVEKLEKNENDFAAFFANQVLLANRGDRAAIACVESYLQPTLDTGGELDKLGIHPSQWNSMQKCTDSGRLVLVTAMKYAPQVFE